MASHLRAKGVYTVEVLQLREVCNKSNFTNLALLAMRQSKWGKRNGEYMLEVWDYEDACSDPMAHPTLIGALDEEGMKKLAASCLKILGRHAMAKEIGTEIRHRKEERGSYDKRTDREGIDRELKGRPAQGEQAPGEKIDMAGEEGGKET